MNPIEKDSGNCNYSLYGSDGSYDRGAKYTMYAKVLRRRNPSQQITTLFETEPVIRHNSEG